MSHKNLCFTPQGPNHPQNHSCFPNSLSIILFNKVSTLWQALAGTRDPEYPEVWKLILTLRMEPSLVIDPGQLTLRFTSFPWFEIFHWEAIFPARTQAPKISVHPGPSRVSSYVSSWQDSLHASETPLRLCAPIQPSDSHPAFARAGPLPGSLTAQPPWAYPSAPLWPLIPMSLPLLHHYCICPWPPWPVSSLNPSFPPGLSEK